MTQNPLAQAELSRALAARGAERIERLVKLSQTDPTYAPVWLALAEEHWQARRREEAVQAAKKGLRLDPSLHRHLSLELGQATRHILAEKEPRPAPKPAASMADAARRAAQEAPAVDPRRAAPRGRSQAGGAPVPDAAATRELEQAALLVGYRRRQRLEELAQKYPDHGPTRLALAEEYLAQHGAGLALESLKKALALDPSLEPLMSPELERAWRYHQKDPMHSPGDMPRDQRAAALPVPSQSATPAPEPGKTPTPDARGAELAGMDRMLATALGLRDREERITVLQQLSAMAPGHVDVLFHLAQELAIALRHEDARLVGNQLRTVSPERYAELYMWAEEYLSRPRPEPEPPAVKKEPEPPAARQEPEPPKESELTQVLNLLGREAEKSARDKAASAAPVARRISLDELEHEPTVEEATIKSEQHAWLALDFERPDEDTLVSARRALEERRKSNMQARHTSVMPPESLPMEGPESKFKTRPNYIDGADSLGGASFNTPGPMRELQPLPAKAPPPAGARPQATPSASPPPASGPAAPGSAQDAGKRQYTLNKHVIRRDRAQSESGTPPQKPPSPSRKRE